MYRYRVIHTDKEIMGEAVMLVPLAFLVSGIVGSLLYGRMVSHFEIFAPPHESAIARAEERFAARNVYEWELRPTAQDALLKAPEGRVVYTLVGEKAHLGISLSGLKFGAAYRVACMRIPSGTTESGVSWPCAGTYSGFNGFRVTPQGTAFFGFSVQPLSVSDHTTETTIALIREGDRGSSEDVVVFFVMPRALVP